MGKKNQRKRFFNACLKWLYLLGLRRYELVTSLGDLKQDESSDWRDAATVETKARYRSIKVTGDEEVIGAMDDVSLDETACHEMVHAVLAPLEELTEEVIAQLPAGKRDPYYAWKQRELEEVTTHIETVVRDLHKSPKGK